MANFISVLPVSPPSFEIITKLHYLIFILIIYAKELYNVHKLVARSEISGQFIKYSSFKRKGRLNNAQAFCSTNEVWFKYLKGEKTEERKTVVYNNQHKFTFNICHFWLNQISWRCIPSVYLCNLWWNITLILVCSCLCLHHQLHSHLLNSPLQHNLPLQCPYCRLNGNLSSFLAITIMLWASVYTWSLQPQTIV